MDFLTIHDKHSNTFPTGSARNSHKKRIKLVTFWDIQVSAHSSAKNSQDWCDPSGSSTAPRKNPAQAAYQQRAGKMLRKLLLYVKSPWSSLTAFTGRETAGSRAGSMLAAKLRSFRDLPSKEGHGRSPSVQIGAKWPTIWRMCMQVMKIKWEMLRRAFNLSSGLNSCGCIQTLGGEHVGCAMSQLVSCSPKNRKNKIVTIFI